ncbi:MAG: hypothetical protein IJ716_14115 [Lachnospiraceae bacterium]|nr:hypothetical protein [Lachnospiraceae bacterium]
MSRATEDMRNQTVWQTKAESVLRWWTKGLSLEDIAEGEDLTLEQVKIITQQQKA